MTVLASLLVLPLSLFLANVDAATAPDQDPLETMAPHDAREITRHLPGIVVGPVKDMESIVVAEEWWPLKPTRLECERPDDPSKSVELAIVSIPRAAGSPADEPKTGWALELPGGTTRYLQVDGEKGLVSPTTVSTPNGFIIRMDPPEPMVLPGTETGKRVSSKVKIDIYDIHSPTSVDYSGTVDCSWTDLGGWRVRVPSGEYDTRLVRIEYRGGVGPASVKGDNYFFLAKGIGPVAYTDFREISAFIIFSETNAKSGKLKAISHPAN